MKRDTIYKAIRKLEIDQIEAMTIADVLAGEDDDKTRAWLDMAMGDTFTDSAMQNGVTRRSLFRFRKKIEKKAKKMMPKE